MDMYWEGTYGYIYSGEIYGYIQERDICIYLQGRNIWIYTGEGYMDMYRGGIYGYILGRDIWICTGEGYMDVYRGGPVQARIQDFSQGGQDLARSAKFFLLPPLAVFCTPWNCLVQKVN